MGPLRAPWVVVLSITVALSGCAGKDSERKGDDASDARAAEPTVSSAGLGSLTGQVLDDEERPVVGAEVGIFQTPLSTQTDAEGRFTFNDLEPGAYTLAASRLGYGPGTMAFEIVAGRITEVILTLQVIVIPLDPVWFTTTHSGYITCSLNPYYFVNHCDGVLGDSQDHFKLDLLQDLPFKEIVLELVWQPATAATGQELELDLCLPQTDPSTQSAGCAADDLSNDFFEYDTGESPVVLRVGAEEMPLKDHQTYEAWVGSGFMSPYPTVQQAFTLYVTQCFVEKCEDDFTALP